MKRLSFQELAASLEVPVDTLERWIRQGRIPVTRMGASCLFNEENLSHWARQHHLGFGMKKRLSPAGCASGESDIAEALERGVVIPHLLGKTPVEILHEMVQAVPDLPQALAPSLLDRLLERERLGSTGVGRGIAIPHPRTPLAGFPEKNCIVVAFTDTPVPYDAIDRKPVFAFFLLLAPDVRGHLFLLSRLSTFLRDEDFYGLLREKPEKNRLLEALSCKEPLPLASGMGK